MKKTTLFLAVMLMTVAAMAQVKVAILETVDKAQDVSYGVKLLLRSSLTSAISNTPGYEGYDRVDMASIAGEQEFQRTGNVSDNQIKQLGAATGAQYVLVAEAAKYDETSIIITAKMLDVETFGVKSSAVTVSGIKANEMQNSCAILAAQLLGTTPPSAIADQLESSSDEEEMLPSSFLDQIEVKLLSTQPDGTKLYVAAFDENKKYSHSDAVDACACKGQGWRLPTTEELKIIQDKRKAIGGISVWVSYWGAEGGKMMDMMLGVMIPKLNMFKGKVRCVKDVRY